MVKISPVLQNKLNAVNTVQQNPVNATSQNAVTAPLNAVNHDKIYDDLRRRANEVRPNEAKAKLVKENVFQSAASSVKDLHQDVVNLKTAVKTGKMNDTRLGRMNDLGMKLSTGLIATFLAIHSKSKTSAAMSFIGGGAFLAAMQIWPKLFINLPARAKHGFDIGQKYISAQGDKKDFFLDNQFLPWDAYSKEEIDEIGRRMGIDPNSKNAQEKIQRKMQKTALQNRTLWMATAGVATPVMSSLIANRLEPVVTNTIINTELLKTKKMFKDDKAVEEALRSAKKDVRNKKELECLFEQYKGQELDDYFFNRLRDLLTIKSDELKTINPNDAKVMYNMDFGKIGLNEIKAFFEDNTSIKYDHENTEKIKKVVEKFKYRLDYKGEPFMTEASMKEAIKELEDNPDLGIMPLNHLGRYIIGGRNPDKAYKKVSTIRDEIQDAVRRSDLYNEDMRELTFDAEKIEQIFRKHIKVEEKNLPDELVEKIVKEVSKENLSMKEFSSVLNKNGLEIFSAQMEDASKILYNKNYDKAFDAIRKFNEVDLATTRGRVKKYVKALNPLVGSREESVSSQIYNRTMDEFFKKTGIDFEKSKQIAKHRVSAGDALANFFYKNANKTDEEYLEFIKGIVGCSYTPDEAKLIKTAIKNENLLKIGSKETELGGWMDKVIGSLDTEIQVNGVWQKYFGIGTPLSRIKNGVIDKTTEVEVAKLRPLICANFERRLHRGEFDDLPKEDILTARRLIYDHNIYMDAAGAGDAKAIFIKDFNYMKNTVSEKIFDGSKFSLEKQVCPEIGDFADILKNVAEPARKESLIFFPQGRKQIAADGLAPAVQRHALKTYNSKAWLKTIAPIAISLTLVTLLAQFLFGKIDKEYPKEKEGGAK